jgi:hypothetical protein
MEPVTLGVEIWADKDGRPVAFGSSAGVSVLYGIGARVSPSVAESLLALSETPSDKAIAAAPSDKAIRSPRAKK